MWGWRSRSPSGELARRGLSAGRDCAARRVGRERSRQASSVALGSQAALAESQCDTVAPSRRCQDFALNLSAKRRLCNTVGGRGIEGAARCCALSTARSRAAATTNLARSNQSLVLRLRFGEAKPPTLVNVFMVWFSWSAPGCRLPPRRQQTKFCPVIEAISWPVSRNTVSGHVPVDLLVFAPTPFIERCHCWRIR
jgi:hypothetical protein